MKQKKIWLSILLLLAVLSVKAQPADNSQDKLALQYFQEQAYDKAVEIYAQLYNKNQTDFYYSHYLQCLIQTKQYKTAEKIVRQQIKNYPIISKYQVDLGYIYGLQNESGKAKRQYESCIAGITNQSSLIDELANNFLSYQLTDYAVNTYLHGRAISFKEHTYALPLAAIYESVRQYEKAMQEYILLLQAEPNMVSYVESALLNWWIDDADHAKRNIVRQQILKAVNKNTDNKAYNELVIWYAMQEKDFSMALKQAQAFDRQYNTAGATVYEVANLAAANKDYTTAINGYKYIVGMGDATVYGREARMAILDVRLKQIVEDNISDVQSINDLDSQLKKYFETYPLASYNFSLYRRWAAFKADRQHDVKGAIAMLDNCQNSTTLKPQDIAFAKLDLAQLMILDDNIWEAMLLNAQVEKNLPNDTLGSLAKLNNANISLMLGEIEWAKAQLDVLRAATSKMVANDALYLSLLIKDNYDEEDSLDRSLQQFAIASFMVEHHQNERALLFLDSIASNHALTDDVWFLKAKIAKQTGDYNTADNLLANIVFNYPNDLLTDDALFERAQLQEYYLKNSVLAMDLYQQILNDHSDSVYAGEARIRIRQLRGDIQRNIAQ